MIESNQPAQPVSKRTLGIGSPDSRLTAVVDELRAAIEYNPLKHIGIGLGVDTMKLGLQGKSEDYPNIDLRGNVEFQYTGVQLYGKLRF